MIRPQSFIIESTQFQRKHSKTLSVRAANSRPYGSNVRCLKTVNNSLLNHRLADQVPAAGLLREGIS